MAGDQLDISSTVPLDAQAVVMLQYFELLQSTSRFIVSSGNHDLTGEDANGERSAVWLGHARSRGILTDGDAVLVGDTLITVCPWWDGPFGRDAVAAQLSRDAADRPARWIWVYHWPPLDSPTSWTGKRVLRRRRARRLDRRAPPGRGAERARPSAPFKPDGGWADRIGHTWVFNPGRQTGSTPTCIEIDFDAQQATWMSLMGVEQIDLTAATTPPRTLF